MNARLSAAHILADADPAAVSMIRWFGIAVVAFGLAVLALRWWRDR